MTSTRIPAASNPLLLNNCERQVLLVPKMMTKEMRKRNERGENKIFRTNLKNKIRTEEEKAGQIISALNF